MLLLTRATKTRLGVRAERESRQSLSRVLCASAVCRLSQRTSILDRDFYYRREQDMKILGLGGFVYLGCDKSRTAYKIGRSSDPKRRQEEIRKMNPTFSIIFSHYSDNPVRDEQRMHDMFSQKRIGGEWFTLNHEDIRTMVRELADPGWAWIKHIDKDYSDFEIEQMAECALSGRDYDDEFVVRKITAREWECPCCEGYCDCKCDGWLKVQEIRRNR
jgi:hypothetical protein